MKIDLPKKHSGKVAGKKELTPRVILVKIAVDQPVHYRAGQYASWIIGKERRVFSYATPAGDKEIQFLVDISPGGVASIYAQQLAVGDTLEWMSPYGAFVVAEANDSPLLFIATGTGVAPIRAQIWDLLAKKHQRKMTLVFGCGDVEHLLFQKEWEELTARNKNLKVISVCEKGGDDWHGATGLVTKIVPALIKNLPSHQVYVCGNPDMVKAMALVLKANGVSAEKIHTEGYT